MYEPHLHQNPLINSYKKNNDHNNDSTFFRNNKITQIQKNPTAESHNATTAHANINHNKSNYPRQSLTVVHHPPKRPKLNDHKKHHIKSWPKDRTARSIIRTERDRAERRGEKRPNLTDYLTKNGREY